MTPGQRIKHERDNMGLSQEELAEKIGCSSQQVKRWENDIAFPQPIWRRKLAEQFGKSIEELGLVPRGKKSDSLIKDISEEGIDVSTEKTIPNQPLEEAIDTNAQRSIFDPLKKGFSRRAMLIGLSLVAVAGGGAWWFISRETGTTSASQNSTIKNAYQTYYVRPDNLSYEVYDVAWSPDGMLIAGALQDNTVQVWNVLMGKQVQTYGRMKKLIGGVAWSPDGNFIAGASNDGTVQIWNASNREKVLTYKGHAGAVATVAWSYHSNLIASAGVDKTVQIWEAPTGRLLYTYKGHSDLVWVVAWSHDDKRIASGGQDSTVRIWESTTGENALLCSSHSQPVFDVKWSPDDKFVASASGDKTVNIWNSTTGTLSYTYYGHSASVHSASWSPDGKRIASGGGDPKVPTEVNDFTLQTWDALTGEHVQIHKGHTMTIYGVAWSPKGTFIASGGADDTIRIWSSV